MKISNVIKQMRVDKCNEEFFVDENSKETRN